MLTPVFESLPRSGLRSLFYVDLEARKREEVRIKEMFGLDANIDYQWFGDDIVFCSQKAHEKAKECYGEIGFAKLPKDKTLFNHKLRLTI